MVNSLLVSDPQGEPNGDMQPYIIKQSISDYMKNVEKTIDILVSYYEKEIADLNVEITNLREKNEEYLQDLKSRTETCTKCRIRGTSKSRNASSEKVSTSKVSESNKGNIETMDPLFVAETVPENLSAISSLVPPKGAKKRRQNDTKCTESFVPETCDFSVAPFAVESYPDLPQVSSTPLVPNVANRRNEGTRKKPKGPQVSAKKNMFEPNQGLNGRPSIEETVLDGSLVVVQSLKDRNSLPSFAGHLTNADANHVETVGMNETDEIDESVPSSPVIGRSSNSCTSRANLDPNDDSACNKTGRQSKDEENMAKAVGRQLFNGDKGPVCSSEANAIPGTTLGGSKSPVVDCVRPLSPIIASQKKRPRSKNVIPTAEDIFELPQINDTELGKTGNDVDSIFKDTILDDIDADVPKISKPSLGIENLSDAAHHSAEVANSTAKPRTVSVGSEELRPKAQKFIYTRTSLFADGQSRLKLVGSKNKNAKSKENVSRNKTSSSRSNNGKNTVDQEIANASSNTILLLDDSFDVVPNANGKNPGNFKYQENVRKQADRQKLTGRSCKECETYYKGSGLSAEEVQKRMTSCSRHREKFANPNTPPTFWQLDFPPTPGQDEEEVIRKPKRRKKSPLTVMDEEESEEVSETNEKHVRSKRRRPLARRF